MKFIMHKRFIEGMEAERHAFRLWLTC